MLSKLKFDGTTIERNRARGNAYDGSDDLHDDSGACTNNTWKQNDFSSAFPECIQ
jgi:hypothetical protein